MNNKTEMAQVLGCQKKLFSVNIYTQTSMAGKATSPEGYPMAGND